MTFTTASKNHKKYLGIHLTKEMQEFYTENNRTLLREIFKDLNNVERYHVRGLENTVFLKCQFFPNETI